MKKFFIFSFVALFSLKANALIISEIMSNPIGDDSGREWVEIYNDTTSAIDLSGLTISIKGGNGVAVTPVQGGTTLAPKSYAIIASTVSSQTKFLLDYPTYSGPLFRSSISLVNTGTTSIEIKLGGVSANILPAYTAAKEGYTLSLVNGTFVLSNSTPGSDNQAVSSDSSSGSSSSTTTDNQSVIAQLAPPSADIILYLPFNKIVVAGAETDFYTNGMTRAGNAIDGLNYIWAYGDGGQSVGSSTKYRYSYPGNYIAEVEGSNNYVKGVARMNVRVVSPDIAIKNIGIGKYGNYIDINNPNAYDLDLSQWKLSIDGSGFSFPKNTLIAGNSTTRFSGSAMGFASTTVSSSTIVKILFPNMEEVTRYYQTGIKNDFVINQNLLATSTLNILKQPDFVYKKMPTKTVSKIEKINNLSTTTNNAQNKIALKDTRFVSFVKSLFNF